MRARRIEFGAGIAACALSVLAFAFLVFAPIVPICTVAAAQTCPAHAVRYESLAQAPSGISTWLFVLAMLALSLAGGVGAIVEARTGRRLAAIPLWAATVLVFAGCALAAGGAGLIYLPSVLALGLAAYASILSRLSTRNRRATENDHTSE
ncbi:MAG TPA: hypothetical protein VFX24_10770 [Ktedonobacterales bacterium]|nr:hypothetical protein [Ktedonobacterales bacterium]